MAAATSAETRKAKSRLKTLSSSLDEVEAAIEPLFSGEQTLPEILLALEPLQQAKLQTALPYLVYDLVFIYLKTRGIDPKSHPVINELDRVRQYFEKIKNAENPAVRVTQVDKAAATRFIKHAISQAQIDADASGAKGSPSAAGTPASISSPSSVAANANGSSNSISTPAPVHVPAKVTSKMLERAEWQKRVEEAGSEEESDIEGWEVNTITKEDGKGKMKVKSDSKGKGKALEVEEVEAPGSKRRRPVMDPFAASGYDIDSDNASDSHPTKKLAVSRDASSIPDPSSSSPSTPSISKIERKKLKKQKKLDTNNATNTKGTKESKNGRVAQLLAEVAASQGVTVSSGSEDNDVEMSEPGSSLSGTPVPNPTAGGGKKRKKKGKK
ncbi:Sas10/Utp3/C1D family-domain-containing protein [Rhodocollybia butyracea]|uniref:Exosome complex protein n=1 Tax=Rhodocollybia butyracea TaxID=206335 RepID=A0A9P5UCB7_9AGAR|nr:Sas10/Utp3/C1D family-domain-containing protein [Rhodocollybia butyracea]